MPESEIGKPRERNLMWNNKYIRYSQAVLCGTVIAYALFSIGLHFKYLAWGLVGVNNHVYSQYYLYFYFCLFSLVSMLFYMKFKLVVLLLNFLILSTVIVVLVGDGRELKALIPVHMILILISLFFALMQARRLARAN
jgi:hypothetical protein